MAGFLPGVLRLQQQAHLDRRQCRMVEARAPLDVARARCPREVVDVLLVEMMALPARLRVPDVQIRPGGADDPSRRNAQPDIVDTEVRQTLRGRVKLVAVPA